MDDILPGLIESRAKVYYTMGVNAEFDQRVIGWSEWPAGAREARRQIAT